MIVVFRLVKNFKKIQRHFQEVIIFDILLFSILINLTKESGNDHIIRSRPLQIFCKVSVHKEFLKFTGKDLCQILALNNVAG